MGKVMFSQAKVVALAIVGVLGLWLMPSAAQAGHWNVFFNLRPTVLDAGNSGPTAGCGTWFRNTNTPLGAGDFQRCAGGTPATDDRITDGNHLTNAAITFNASNPAADYTLPAWALDGGAVLRFEDANGDGVPENGASVRLIWFANEQHTRSANIPLYGGDVRVHMHTRGVMADVPNANNCPSTISVTGQPVRTVTCMGSYDPSQYQALGTWNSATNRVVWNSNDIDPGAGVQYDGQLRNVHNFGYVDCTSSASGCSQGSLSQGLNWKQGYTDWRVAQVTGGNVAEGPLRDFVFNGAINFLTATTTLSFSTAADLLVDSASTGGAHNSWWRLRGNFNGGTSYVYIPEPGTALLVLGGLVGLIASRRRQN